MLMESADSTLLADNLPQDLADAIVDARTYADPERLHALYRWARANCPLGRVRTAAFEPFWLVTKHADLMHVSRNNALFHNADYSTVLMDKATIDNIRLMTGGDPNLVRTLVQMDDPDHRKMRAITQSWFMPANVAKLESRIRDLARAEVERMAGLGGQCDFVADLALGYPLRVVMEILGVPREDEPRMLMLTQELFGPEDPELSRTKQDMITPEQRAAAFGAVLQDFGAYFNGIVEARRRNPGSDLATVLAHATLDGEPLSERYRTSYFVLVATAGHDTTSSSTATAMWALCQFPQLLAELKRNPALIPAFVDEAIRWASPVRHFMRTATADTELGGRQIAKGDWLMLCYGSANRDEDVFERPDEFRVDRTTNKHLAFGYGAHTCLGMHLARLEMRLLFEELLPRLDAAEMSAPMQSVAASFVGGPKRLPIRYRLS